MIYIPTRTSRETGTFTFNSQEYSVKVLDNFQVPHLVVEGNNLKIVLRMEKPDYWFTTYVSSPFRPSNLNGMGSLKKNPGLAEALNKFLKSKDKDSGVTCWIKTIRNWNLLNPDHTLSEDTPVPDYTKAVYNHDKALRWGARLRELEKNAEARFPKYEVAWCTLSGYDADNLKEYYRQGYRIVGTISCGNPVVFLERPAVDIHEIVEDEFL